MKLSTRLALVVTLVISLMMVLVSADSLIAMRNSKFATYEVILKKITDSLRDTKEDPVSIALYAAESSPIPMSLAFVANQKDVSYLSDNAGSQLELPSENEFKNGLTRSIEKDKKLVRYFRISSNEYLMFFLSTSEIDQEINRTLKQTIFFDLLILALSGLLIAMLFKRDTRLNHAARGMQEFIGNASHELKTPLTVIRGYSEILSNNPENVVQYAQRINDQSLRMSGIIDQMLKIAALDEGEIEEPVSIDIAHYLKSHIEDITMLQPSRSITFISQPLMIKAPYDLVDTLLSNVLTNARIHSPESTPIQVSINGKQVVIEDGGPGLKQIPDKPFQRFDSSRSRETGGSGLGMSLIQKCAKELGAKLNFGKSELGGLRVEINF